MKDLKEIKADIRKLVSDTIASGTIGHVQFFTARILVDHPDIQGEDADFYTICAQETVKNMVKAAVGKYDQPQADTPLLEGFEHLQEAYPVHRNGEHLLVPVHFVTDEEFELRCAQYEGAIKGYVKHVQEIRAYVINRRDEAEGQGALRTMH